MDQFDINEAERVILKNLLYRNKITAEEAYKNIKESLPTDEFVSWVKNFIVNNINHIPDIEDFAKYVYKDAQSLLVTPENIEWIKKLIEDGAKSYSSKETDFAKYVYKDAQSLLVTPENLEWFKKLIEDGAKSYSSKETDFAKYFLKEAKSLLLTPENIEWFKKLIEDGAESRNSSEREFTKDIVRFLLLTSDEFEWIKKLVGEGGVQSIIEKLAREGEVKTLQKFGEVLDVKDLKPNSEKNFFPETKDSCFGKPDSLTKIDITKVTYPFNVAQNFCDTMIKLENGKILVVRGHESRDVYKYLSDKRAEHLQEEKEATAKPHEFTAYFNPNHGFFSLDGEPEGFYPADSGEKGALAQDKTAEYVAHGLFVGAMSTGATAFLSSAMSISIPMLLPVFLGSAMVFSAVAGKVYYNFYDKYKSIIDHKLGRISGEESEQAKSDANNYLKISFLLNDEQEQKVQSYIKAVKEDCKSDNPDKCVYNFISRSCLGFVQDVFKAAGLKGHYVDYLTVNQAEYNAKDFLYKGMLVKPSSYVANYFIGEQSKSDSDSSSKGYKVLFNSFLKEANKFFGEAYDTKALAYTWGQKSYLLSEKHVYLPDSTNEASTADVAGEQQHNHPEDIAA